MTLAEIELALSEISSNLEDLKCCTPSDQAYRNRSLELLKLILEASLLQNTPLYPYSYETCALESGVEVTVRVLELRDFEGTIVNRKVELPDGTDVSATATLQECSGCSI